MRRRSKPAPTRNSRATASTTLSAIVPVYNEEYLVRPSLERLASIAGKPGLKHLEILVVDDGSADRSWEEIRKFAADFGKTAGLSVRAFRHDRNRGKGASIRTAIDHARGEITIIHDADLEYDPRDILAIVRVFLEEDADAVFGSRFLSGTHRRVLYFHHELGNRFLTLACNVLTNLNLTDMETGYKAVRTEIFKSIPIESDRFTVEPELAVKLAKRGAKIYEVPIRYAGRTYQEGKKIGWIDGMAALFAMVRFKVSDKLYRGDPYGSRILERMGSARRYNRWMADSLSPFCGDRILEIGAGIGSLARELLPRSLYYATDSNADYLRRMKAAFDNRPYVKVAFCDATKPESFPRPSGLFDTVVCLNVMEHMEDDESVLKSIESVLAPGGRAIILVPNVPGLYGTLDEVVGHKRRYNRALVSQRAALAGLSVERIRPFNRLGSAGWFINGKVLRRRHFSLGQVWLLDLLSPILRLIDPVLPLPALSLIAVLGKPRKPGP